MKPLTKKQLWMLRQHERFGDEALIRREYIRLYGCGTVHAANAVIRRMMHALYDDGLLNHGRDHFVISDLGRTVLEQQEDDAT